MADKHFVERTQIPSEIAAKRRAANFADALDEPAGAVAPKRLCLTTCTDAVVSVRERALAARLIEARQAICSEPGKERALSPPLRDDRVAFKQRVLDRREVAIPHTQRRFDVRNVGQVPRL